MSRKTPTVHARTENIGAVDARAKGLRQRSTESREALEASRSRAEEALRKSAADLARSNAELREFAIAASHDLQEPLRTVGGFVQLLQRKYGHRLDAEAQTFIQYALEGVERMEAMIRDLLAYSRVSTQGKESTPTDAGQALSDALANLRLLIVETRAEVSCGELPTVRADLSQLVQLFQNLLGNALKFRSEAAPKIEVVPAAKETSGSFRCATTASASSRNSTTRSSRRSAACTVRRNIPAPASAWRPARKSSNATAAEFGWNQNWARGPPSISRCPPDAAGRADLFGGATSTLTSPCSAARMWQDPAASYALQALFNENQRSLPMEITESAIGAAR